MSPSDLEPLSAEAARLLAKEREFPTEPAELRARVLARARAVSRGVTPLVGRRLRARPALLVAAAVTIAFAAVSFAAWQNRDPVVPDPPPANGASLDRAPRGLERPAAPAPEVVEETKKPEPQPIEKPGGVAAPSQSSPSDAYALELAILGRARAAVAKAEFSKALDAIAEHQRRYPAGKLREEREALRVKALSGLGRNEEARAAAERFRERFPGSVLTPRLQEATRPAP